MNDFERRFANAIQKKRLAHALLFVGEDQNLLEKTALDLLTGIFCENKKIPFGCNICQSCKAAENKHHPRIRVLLSEPESTGEIKIDQIRDLISASGRPSWLIPTAHLMNEQAGNALLKTLEEPRADQFFILMAPNIRSLLPTLVSRCQRVFFGNPSKRETSGDFREIPSGLLERMELIERLSKEKAALPEILSAWTKDASVEFKEALLKAQQDFKKHVNPQLILEELLLSKKV